MMLSLEIVVAEMRYKIGIRGRGLESFLYGVTSQTAMQGVARIPRQTLPRTATDAKNARPNGSLSRTMEYGTRPVQLGQEM